MKIERGSYNLGGCAEASPLTDEPLDEFLFLDTRTTDIEDRGRDHFVLYRHSTIENAKSQVAILTLHRIDIGEVFTVPITIHAR